VLELLIEGDAIVKVDDFGALAGAGRALSGSRAQSPEMRPARSNLRGLDKVTAYEWNGNFSRFPRASSQFWRCAELTPAKQVRMGEP
jgi:hypothetical protein